jgi:hypothetical protein
MVPQVVQPRLEIASKAARQPQHQHHRTSHPSNFRTWAQKSFQTSPQPLTCVYAPTSCRANRCLPCVSTNQTPSANLNAGFPDLDAPADSFRRGDQLLRGLNWRARIGCLDPVRWRSSNHPIRASSKCGITSAGDAAKGFDRRGAQKLTQRRAQSFAPSARHTPP